MWLAGRRSLRSAILNVVCSHRRHLRLDNLRTLVLADNNLSRIQLSTDDDGASSVSEEEECEWVSYVLNYLVPVTEWPLYVIFRSPCKIVFPTHFFSLKTNSHPSQLENYRHIFRLLPCHQRCVNFTAFMIYSELYTLSYKKIFTWVAWCLLICNSQPHCGVYFLNQYN